jgi:hypothetical protein
MMNRLRERLAEDFRLRWMLATAAGWVIGLYAGVLNPVCFAGAGLVAGVAVGWAQRRAAAERLPPAWLRVTLTGAALGFLPAALFGAWALLNGWAWWGVAGLVMGGGVGLAQGSLLQQGRRWAAVNALAGLVCGVLTVLPIIPGLPIGLLLGTAFYGYLTAWLLERGQILPPD